MVRLKALFSRAVAAWRLPPGFSLVNSPRWSDVGPGRWRAVLGCRHESSGQSYSLAATASISPVGFELRLLAIWGNGSFGEPGHPDSLARAIQAAWQREQARTLYARLESTVDPVLLNRCDPSELDLAGKHRDVVIYKDPACTVEKARFCWFRESRPRNGCKSITLNCAQWPLVWV